MVGRIARVRREAPTLTFAQGVIVEGRVAQYHGNSVGGEKRDLVVVCVNGGEREGANKAVEPAEGVSGAAGGVIRVSG